MYTRCIEWVPKGFSRKREHKKTALPQLYSTQSTKPIKGIKPSSISMITHNTIPLRKEHFSN